MSSLARLESPLARLVRKKSSKQSVVRYPVGWLVDVFSSLARGRERAPLSFPRNRRFRVPYEVRNERSE
ncbi:hypothetical protein HALLA_16725 [Halostagnicola larsenii XH-48]|uniref:Uncharacterized protein n=1 Tax=Halostagnicola larsenii XH-48 TaxID=797299 RepID=W0JQU7_9EURY|nr:hypothetical protein HALLA_16725 [Halostagnicola larsenii XH-48]